MTPRSRARAAVLALTAALALSACGGDPDEAADLTTDQQAPDQDGQDGQDGGDALSDDGTVVTDPSSWLGLTQPEAEERAAALGIPLRVSRMDDMMFPLTEDYSVGRVTIEVDFRGGDDPIVTAAVVETTNGPVEARAEDSGPNNLAPPPGG